MDAQLNQKVCRLLGVAELLDVEPIQELWSGCGQVARLRWAGGMGEADRAPGEPGRAVMKHVKMPAAIDHPRGWNTDGSVRRKARSYEVETRWYARWSARCPAACRVPRYLGDTAWGDERVLLLEDVDAGGYPRRVTRAADAELDACVRWLAALHGAFLSGRPSAPPPGLWAKGTYWHLDTRPDEWARMPEGALKEAARPIDHALAASGFQTVVHGDAKLANFCFPDGGAAVDRVAAVDFQYVGGGCGMKDLAYLVGGCLDSEGCFSQEERVLGLYFEALGAALDRRGVPVDRAALEADWRRLYPYAWADFQRFLLGWSPGHWKISPYSEHMTRRVLAGL